MALEEAAEVVRNGSFLPFRLSYVHCLALPRERAPPAPRGVSAQSGCVSSFGPNLGNILTINFEVTIFVKRIW